FVGEEDHWLPPDNFQEIPQEVLAHRTSPTNIGLLLLANVAAYDLGFIGITEFVERTEQTLSTLTRLKTFNGHLYNWYDTRTLAPLDPRSISTVDSGNLASVLIILRQFVLGVADATQPLPNAFQGVRDTVEELRTRTPNASGFSAIQQGILQEVLQLLQNVPHDPVAQEHLLNQLQAKLESAPPDPAADREIQFWWDAVRRVVVSHLADYARPQDRAWRLLE